MQSFDGKFRLVAAAGLVAFAALLSGCQSSDNSLAGVDTTAPPPPQEKITQSELEAYCPSITVREGTAAFDTYAKGAAGDASQVVYRSSIADATRACKRSDGQMRIDIAVAGRVVPGPQAKVGSVTMPIRVVVTVAGEVAYTQLHQYQVSISDTSSATQFLFKDPNVVIPTPADGTARVFVGFDEGPKKEEQPEG
jgi:hypothetical protein